MQMVSLGTDIKTRLYLLSPSLVGPFEREANEQRGPARGAWSDLVASSQSGTRFGSVYGDDPALSWGSPNGQWYTGWLEPEWMQMDDRLTGGELVVSLERETSQGMGRVTNSKVLREVLSIHSSNDAGDNTPGGGGRHPTMVIKRPSADPSLTCISPTGSEAKSDRTVKGSEAIKSLYQVNRQVQCVNRVGRGNVAPATDSRPIREHCSCLDYREISR